VTLAEGVPAVVPDTEKWREGFPDYHVPRDILRVHSVTVSDVCPPPDASGSAR